MDAFDKSGNLTNASSEVRKGLESQINNLAACTCAVIRWWYATLMFVATTIWGLGDLAFHDPMLTTCETVSRLIYLGGQ